MARESSRQVCEGLALAIRGCGVPGEILTDNGKVFTGRFNQPPAEVLFDRIGIAAAGQNIDVWVTDDVLQFFDGDHLLRTERTRQPRTSPQEASLGIHHLDAKPLTNCQRSTEHDPSTINRRRARAHDSPAAVGSGLVVTDWSRSLLASSARCFVDAG